MFGVRMKIGWPHVMFWKYDGHVPSEKSQQQCSAFGLKWVGPTSSFENMMVMCPEKNCPQQCLEFGWKWVGPTSCFQNMMNMCPLTKKPPRSQDMFFKQKLPFIVRKLLFHWMTLFQLASSGHGIKLINDSWNEVSPTSWFENIMNMCPRKKHRQQQCWEFGWKSVGPASCLQNMINMCLWKIVNTNVGSSNENGLAPRDVFKIWWTCALGKKSSTTMFDPRQWNDNRKSDKLGTRIHHSCFASKQPVLGLSSSIRAYKHMRILLLCSTKGLLRHIRVCFRRCFIVVRRTGHHFIPFRPVHPRVFSFHCPWKMDNP